MCRALTKSEFTARFDSLSARITEVDPATAEGRRELMQLFDEHSAVATQLKQSHLAHNMQLNVADTRVLMELMSAMASGMRAAARSGEW